MLGTSLLNNFSRNFTLSRVNSPGGYVDGYYVQQSRTNTEVNAVVVPFTEREIMLLSEGDRLKEWVKIYSDFPFTLQEPGANTGEVMENDLVIIDGKTFQVMSCKNWNMAANKMTLGSYESTACTPNRQTVKNNYPATGGEF